MARSILSDGVLEDELLTTNQPTSFFFRNMWIFGACCQNSAQNGLFLVAKTMNIM
jgi:hypothetical protein